MFRPLLARMTSPAWKRWGTARAVKQNTTILHSRADDVVPFADSEELVVCQSSIDGFEIANLPYFKRNPAFWTHQSKIDGTLVILASNGLNIVRALQRRQNATPPPAPQEKQPG